MAKQANKHYQELDFGPKDMVQVTTKNQKTKRPSHMLDHQIAGPYKVLEQVGNAYRLKLPNSIKVHLVFLPNKLCKASIDLLLGQKKDPLLPIQVNDKDKWEVEEVLASKLVWNTLKYQVNWRGFDLDLDWYLAWNLVGSPYKLEEFHDKYPNQPGPPKYLDEWLKCQKDGKDLVEHYDRNSPKA